MVGVGIKRPIWALGGAYSPPNTAVHSPSLLDVLGGEPGGPIDGASLTVALDVIQAWAVLITIGFTIVLFIFLAFCVCAKKDDGYDEYELSQGITTVKVCHDGGENGLGSYPRINGSNTPRGSDEASEASSRCTLKRELPAIPLSAQPDPAASECKVERTQSQHSSDLYAAVGDVNDAKVIGGVQVLPANAIGQGGRAAVIRDASITSPTSPTSPPTSDASAAAAHPYAKVKKNHPYAHVKLPKKDHPYAKVVRDDSEDPETDTDNYDDPKAITKDKGAGWKGESTYEPAPPVPEKRFDIEEESTQGATPAESGLMSTSVTSASSAKGPSSPRSPHLTTRSSITPGSEPSPTSPHGAGTAADRPPSAEIPAAMAISGRTPANEELPYMTPPLLHAGIELPQQQNFSGDSQDSRGYTSISVREPLAALKAQTAGTAASQSSQATQPMEGEGYYMTVSDDSADEMYACIYEGTRGVGSETYAQIEPRSTPPPPPPQMPSPPHAPSTPSPLSARGGSQPPPAPPSVDSLRHVVHSRQASSSSAASTVMGSPGAEKRGTRSPLPPLPQGDNSLYSAPSPQPPHSPPRSVPPAERPTQRALEEMYAKVMKKQRPGHSRGNSSGGGESDNGSESSSRRGSVDIGGGRWGSHHSTPPTTPRQSVDLGAMTHSLIETRNNDTSKSISRAKSYETASIWSGTSQQSQPLPKPNPNYETIPQHPGNFYSGGSDPGYETVKNSEPPYASVERPEENYPGYETVKPTSDIESEPGYETLKHREYEPGYETVTGEAKQTASEPGYETVASKTTQEDDEPGYETVAHQTEAADPGYETVKGKSTSEFGDPGYEELKSTVHHIRTTSEHDPNYEQLKFTSRRSSDGDAEPGYEVVKKVETESTYESVRDYDIPEKYPPYEKIDKTEKSEAQQTPVYASVVRKGSKSPDKKSPSKESPDADKDTGATGLLESDLDNLPPLEPKGELITIETRNENQNISVTTRVKTPSPVKSPSPPLKSPSPPLKESPVSSPEKVLPPEVPEVKSPEKSPPAMVKAEEKGSPTLDRSPDSESPCLTKSPDSMSEMSPEKEEVPFGIPPDTQRKSPSPPLHEDDSLAKDSLQGKSVKKDSSPEKAPESVFVLPEKGSPPSMKLFEKESPTILVTMEKDPSIDQDSSMIADSPEKETPPEVASADKETTEKVVCDVEDKESVSKDRDSLDETSSGTTGSPDKMPSSPLDSSPVIEEQPVGKSLLEELQESTETIETFSQPLPPAPDSKEMEEQSSSFQENPSLPPPLLIQDEPHPISSSIDECAVRENLPSPPPSQSPQRSSSPTTVDHFGSEPPLPLPETHAQPTETVNPLYVTDNGIPPIEPSAINENAADEGESHVSLCGELPPPPPPMEVDDTTFPNDLPPPLPEIAPLVNTLPEDTPPPLVPPADVEGLDDMLTLANMGSSSSGSTAVQLGSAHGSSEKDSESPQDNEGNQMEVVSVIDDLPPPPPPSDEPEAEQDSDEELDNSVSSGYELGFTAGGITVTVNPMADVTEKSESPDPIPPPPVSEPSQVVPPSPIAVSAIISSSTGSQSSSSGSGSQDTGSGSIESVVTVECAPPPPPGDVSGGGSEGISESQHYSESPSSPESRPLDPHEQITEV
ncbi:mucin-2-like isoform X2 [Macrobrachium nipponense]|uniref:mucin-2-like isoform X2 n=1 Tax=Macrobrachium nipponense TaxID=159736 RepID=UPI0030C860C4